MGVILMLMTIGGVIAAVVLLAVSLFTKKAWLTKFTVGGLAVWVAFYAALLLGSSLMSAENTLALNEPKEFCGFYLDCHLHAAVTGVRTAKNMGDMIANGEFYIVKVKVFSNARREPLGLLTVDARVVDAANREYVRDFSAESQLLPQPEFERRIAPNESFEKEIVFDLPPDATNPRLDVREGYGIDHAIEAIIVDDEDSIFHRRNYFQLQEQNQTVSVKKK